MPLTAYPRTAVRRAAVKKLRAAQRVPAVIYGRQRQPQNLELQLKALEDLIHHAASETILVDLTIEGDPQPGRLALLQEVQHHPLTGRPLHVDFHEVGAVDAIVDVVGTVFGLHELGVGRLSCSELPLMSGQVECAHGTLPLPAPATAELLRGAPVRGLPGDAELVTPTGAALVVTLAESFGPPPPMTVATVGVGLGHRDLGRRPNLLRLLVGAAVGAAETATQLEAAVDDMPAEHFDFLLDRLHAAGAVEVLFVPAQMKKNRPGVLVRALCAPEVRAEVRRALLDHSTTLGVREWLVERATLRRGSFSVRTTYGELRVKRALKPGGSERLHVEYDDLKRAAGKAGATLAEVEAAALAVARRTKR